MPRAAARAALVLSMAVFMGLALVHLGVNLMHGDAAAAPSAPQWAVPEGLADGDIVFRTGRDMMARLVLSQGESPRFSHVGLVFKRGEDIFVVHAIPPDDANHGGVRVESILRFMSAENAVDVGFYRVKAADALSRQRMREYALQQVGKPFDDAFEFSNGNRLYCTELVLKAMAAGGVELSASLRPVDVMMLAEPVFPPDYLRRSAALEALAGPLPQALQSPMLPR